MQHSFNLSGVPIPSLLKSRLQALAMLDAVLMPDWEMRYFSFNSQWALNEMMASMRDGEGAEFFFLFNQAGVAGKLFCPEMDNLIDMATLRAEMPAVFASFVKEPAFDLERTSCVVWQEAGATEWKCLPVDRSPIPLLSFVGDQGEYYRSWAEGYYETSISAAAVKSLFELRALDKGLVSALNPEADFEQVLADAEEIGYPTR